MNVDHEDRTFGGRRDPVGRTELGVFDDGGVALGRHMVDGVGTGGCEGLVEPTVGQQNSRPVRVGGQVVQEGGPLDARLTRGLTRSEIEHADAVDVGDPEHSLGRGHALRRVERDAIRRTIDPLQLEHLALGGEP